MLKYDIYLYLKIITYTRLEKFYSSRLVQNSYLTELFSTGRMDRENHPYMVKAIYLQNFGMVLNMISARIATTTSALQPRKSK